MTFIAFIYLHSLLLLFSPQDTTLNNLIVYGEHFKFGVEEPKGWIGDTQNAAELSSNIVFYQNIAQLKDADGVIRIRVNEKVDENTKEDLEYDMKSYQKEYPKIKFKKFRVSHEQYQCFPMLFYIQGKFYEYVTYINPGKDTKFTLSVSMNKPKNEASEQELKAYLFVVSSLSYLGDS
jgi:hypothetical protein